MNITIGTYNLMKPNSTANKHNKAWDQRKVELMTNIASAKTDILCVQELSSRDENWLKTAAQQLGYELFYASCKEGSGVGVLYQKEKLILVDQKTGIYSGKDENGEKRTRAFVQLDLEDKTTKTISRVASMHLYGGTSRGNPLGREQIESFRNQIEQNDTNVSQIILAGDFNSDAKDENEKNLNGPCTYLLNSPTAYSYNTVPADGKTPFIRTTNKSNRHLDWVFVGIKNPNGTKNLADLEIVPLSNQITNASDHLLHAVRIKGTVAQDQLSQTPSTIEIKQELSEELIALLKRKGRFVRNDVHHDKETANQKIRGWIQSGLIKQVGHGRDTYYELASGSSQVSSKEKSAKSKSWSVKSVAKAIGEFIVEFFKAIFKAASRRDHHSSHKSHRVSHRSHKVDVQEYRKAWENDENPSPDDMTW